MDAVVADRLLPNLFLLGNPKSGSTFLFGCLRSSFAPNLVCGATALPAWRTCEHSYVLTALGSKKEFNFWGSTGRRWGLEWYAGPSLPLSAWEWLPASAGERPWRRGENHELEPSRHVTETCLLNTNAPGRAACARFPLECVHGTLVVRPGCGVMRPHPSRRACAAAGGARACAAPRVFMSHAFPRRAEVAARAYALDPSINTFMFAPMWKAATQRLRPIRSPAHPASARSSSGRPLASARLGQLADTLWLAGRTGLVFHIGPLLHAWSLAVPHPTEGQGVLRVAAPLPADMHGLVAALWPQLSADDPANWPRVSLAQMAAADAAHAATVPRET